MEGDGGRAAGVGERDSVSDTLCRIYDPAKGLPNNKPPVNVTLWVFVILGFLGFFRLPYYSNNFPLSGMDNVYFADGISYLTVTL